MAERYGLLPSEVLARATTHDIYVYDVAMSFQEHVREKHKRKHAPSDAVPQQGSATLEKLYREYRNNE